MHNLLLLLKNIFIFLSFKKVRCETTGSPSSKYMVYATACVYRELYGKITDRKKNCVNNYLLWNKVFLPQMCGEHVSCAEFRAILTPFSEVIWRRSNGFRITSLNGVRMALNSAQETSSPHIWGRKTLFQRDSYLHNFFYDRLFSHSILYIHKLSHTPRILSLGSLWWD